MKISEDRRIEHMFEAAFGGKRPEDLSDLRCNGTPLFTEEQIHETTWPWDQLLRKICVRNNITVEYFNERYHDYMVYVCNQPPSKVNTQKNNLLKALYHGHITYKRFDEALSKILGFRVVNIHIDVVDGRGQSTEYSLIDPPQEG